MERIREWISTFPDFDILGALQVDYTDQIPGSGGLFPSGMVEITRKEDILGNVTVVNQLNFGLYCRFEKDCQDDALALSNAQWVLSFQKWVQEQSARGLTPKIGNTETKERVQAQNGVLFEQDEEGTALYMIQLSVRYETFYEVI